MKAVNLEKLLPGDIPQGERILWHGRPEWIGMARRAFRVDMVAAYFGVMTAWNVALATSTVGLDGAIVSAVKTLGSGALAIGLLCLLAWLASRTSLYVVTSRRVVMKVGIALPVFFNLPFTRIASASLRVFADGSGDIPLALHAGDHIAYLHLWPHARPFRITYPEPALRSVPKAAEVAEVLSRALIAASNEASPTSVGKPHSAPIQSVEGASYPADAVAAA
jgi:hypothetical protein